MSKFVIWVDLDKTKHTTNIDAIDEILCQEFENGELRYGVDMGGNWVLISKETYEELLLRLLK